MEKESPKKIFASLPGAPESKAALFEFENTAPAHPAGASAASSAGFEEQQQFDFGKEFSHVPTTAAMLEIEPFPESPLALISEASDDLGDSQAQMDFDEAVRQLALEAEQGLAAVEVPEPVVLNELQLPHLDVRADDELMSALGKIPDQMAFKIGDVAEMVGVKQYVLRYWESEFEALHPRKSKNGQRVYTRRDVETALMIKKLLYTDRFSIEGARAAIRQLKSKVREEREWRKVLGGHDRVKLGLENLLGEIRRLRDQIV